ncbi:MAG: hypothetical protein IJA91_05830 [Clostridia bacterium]|nr:hypothetical protein [Clostridia bacterium]
MNKNKKRLKLLDPMRDGKGVEKGEDTTPNLKYFFKLWGRKFWKLISLNFFMLVQILPLLGCVFLYTSGPKVSTQYDPLYTVLLGAQTALPTSEGMTLFNSAAGLLHEFPIFNSWAHWVMGGLILFHLITYGWQKVGSTYILRNLVRGDGVFMFSDYFYAIKRNLKQGFIMGLIDSVAIFALVFDFIYFYNTPATSFGNSVMYIVIFALILIYGVMRFYTYLMMVTFDMKLGKIFKNALIFTMLGVLRNIMALLGILLLVGISAALIIFLVPLKVAVVIIIPFLCLLAFCGFMYTYAAYPVIQKYMIDPVKKPVPAPTFDSND